MLREIEMGSVFRKSYTKPLPAGAEVFEQKGVRYARWKNAQGKTRTAPLTSGKNGNVRIQVTTATYTARY